MNESARELKRLRELVKARTADKERLQAVSVMPFIADVYKDMHADLESGQHQYYNLKGGRGSGKSSFISLEIVNSIAHDTSGQHSAIIFRRYANTMRDSVYSQIMWAIDMLGIGDMWQTSISPMQFTFMPTGAQILFKGLDDASKLKSIKPHKGYFKYIWLEEFSELQGENFTRNVMQSVLRGGTEFTVFRSYNPPISKSNWANVFIARADDRAITLHTSYLDMPCEWLGDSFIYEAERLKEINEKAYLHEYLGEATGTGGEVFPNITTREITDDEIKQMQYIYAGVDFGFSTDPFVYMRVAYDGKTDTVYLIDEIYKHHFSNQQIADAIIERHYDKELALYPHYNSYLNAEVLEQKSTIICDSASPKDIHDLRGKGLKAIGCRKFQGSVLYGIKWLQHRNIVIDPKRTPNAYNEFINYEYLTTKDGEFLADVPDENNHCIDAVRYALDRLINKPQISA